MKDCLSFDPLLRGLQGCSCVKLENGRVKHLAYYSRILMCRVLNMKQKDGVPVNDK